MLQAGQPDNDILLYWPIHDTWHDPPGMEMRLTIHGARWFEDKPIGKLAEKLWARGFTFDYVSRPPIGRANDGQRKHCRARRPVSRRGRARMRAHAAGDFGEANSRWPRPARR